MNIRTVFTPIIFRNYLARLFNVFIILSVFIGALVGIVVVQINQPVYILFTLAGLIILVGAVRSVGFELVVLTVLVYSRLSDIVVHRYNLPSVAQLFIVLLVVAILMRWAIYHETPRGWSVAALLLGLYGLVGFASLLYAHYPGQVVESLLNYIKDGIITILVVILLQTRESFRRVVWVLIGIGAFLGTLSIYQYLTGTYHNDYWGFATARLMEIVAGQTDDYRIGGPIGDPNFYAQIMIVIVPISLERFIHERRISLRIFALLSFLLTTFTVILTYSRGGFVALSLALCLFFYIFPLRMQHVPLLIVAFVIGISLAPPNYWNRILTLNEYFQTPGTSLSTKDMSLRERANQSLVAMEMIKDHPLFGVGWNNYRYLFLEYSRKTGLVVDTTVRAAHDLYLEVLAETGIIGLGVFLAIIGVAGETIIKAYKHYLKSQLADYAGMVSGFGIGCFAYMIAAFFIHAAYPRYFYLLLGVALALRKIIENTDNMPPNPSSTYRGK